MENFRFKSAVLVLVAAVLILSTFSACMNELPVDEPADTPAGDTLSILPEAPPQQTEIITGVEEQPESETTVDIPTPSAQETPAADTDPSSPALEVPQPPQGNQADVPISGIDFIGTDGRGWPNNGVQTANGVVIWFNNEPPALLTQEEAGHRAVHVMQNTGTWRMIEPYLLYMSNADITKMVDIYNSRRPANHHKSANDYFR